MDAVDRASELEQQQRDFSLSKARQIEERPEYIDGIRVCTSCLEPIPVERIEAVDATKCIDCQIISERM